MELTLFLYALATFASLLVVALSLTPGESSPLRLPLGLIGAHEFSWTVLGIGDVLTDEQTYGALSAVIAPLYAPLCLHFTLAFIGKRVAWKRWLFATYAVFAVECAIIAVALLPVFSARRVVAYGSTILLVTCVPVAITIVVLAVQHFRAARSSEERARAGLYLFALAVFLPLLPTDLLADVGFNVPRWSVMGSFAFNSLLSWLMLGLLKATRRPIAVFGQALLVATALCIGYLSIYATFHTGLGFFISGLSVVLVLAVVPLWLTLSTRSKARAGLERFAALGRFSAQMAHDLRNPLAAAMGAAEFLAEEQRRDGRDDAMPKLIVQQLRRLATVIERYQRLSRLEPQLERSDVNALVQRVLSLQRFAAGETIAMETRLDSSTPVAQLDPALLSSALENLVKNAIEAMPHGGRLEVTTELTAEDTPRVVLQVRDTGSGFSARALEQAFEPFHTTKANGTGLGLAFTREVARAHGGDALVESVEGAGTTVSLWLPLDGRVDHPRDS